MILVIILDLFIFLVWFMFKNARAGNSTPLVIYALKVIQFINVLSSSTNLHYYFPSFKVQDLVQAILFFGVQLRHLKSTMVWRLKDKVSKRFAGENKRVKQCFLLTMY
jgi:hypothetical protein